MATLPRANTTINDQAGAIAQGLDYLVLLLAASRNADVTPRVFTSTDAALTQHNYAPGIDYLALHFEETSKPVIVVALPIVTAGTLGSVDTSGNTGTSAVTLSAGADGILEELDLVVTTDTGGVVGTDQIKLLLSCDGGRTEKTVRLGTASSYTHPYFGFVLTFVVGGSLVAGDVVLTAHTTAPRWDQAGLAAARTALSAQQKAARSWLLDGDLVVEDDATDFLTELNGYETAKRRFVYGRAQLPDKRRGASMSRRRVAMTGSPAITFAEVGATGDTITRATGSFITDGFAVGDVITVTGAVASSGANNVTGPIASLSATVITLGTTDLINEGPISSVAIVGSPGITFAEVGATGDTITRTSGSWILDGFKVGDLVMIDGTASNDATTDAITGVSATVLTLDTTDLTAETIGSHSITITTAAQTLAESVAANDAEFADIDDEKRLDLAHGRARKLSPITGYRLRRPAAWAASIREYQHDVHIPNWRKADGALFGWDLEDADGNTVEHDEDVTGGALAARFTCLRTWPNGPAGTFVAMSLTRASENSVLSRTHNMAVANVACSTVQASTENAIGQVLTLSGSKATETSLSTIEMRVNADLARALRQDNGEGARASSAIWRASRNDVLNVPGATLTGTLSLEINGTLEKIDTTVLINSAA